MVSGGFTKDGFFEGNIYPFGVCSLRLMANLVLCFQCSKWIHCRCVALERVRLKFSRNFTSMKCEGNIGEAVE